MLCAVLYCVVFVCVCVFYSVEECDVLGSHSAAVTDHGTMCRSHDTHTHPSPVVT